MTEQPPKKLRFKSTDRELTIAYATGETLHIPYELLRVKSPSAEVRGHGAGERPPPLTGKQNVGVVSANLVGRYALRITFDDGHDSGLFTWDYLAQLGAAPMQQLSGHKRLASELFSQKQDHSVG